MSRLILIVAFALLQVGTSGAAEEPPSDTASARYHRAQNEYAVRLQEFIAGRSPATVVIRSNQRLLRSALAVDPSNAAADYDLRAAKIESLAKVNLDNRTGTKQEVAQATAARLPALLKQLLDKLDFNTK